MIVIKIISSKILIFGEVFKFSIFKFSDLDAVAVLVRRRRTAPLRTLRTCYLYFIYTPVFAVISFR